MQPFQKLPVKWADSEKLKGKAAQKIDSENIKFFEISPSFSNFVYYLGRRKYEKIFTGMAVLSSSLYSSRVTGTSPAENQPTSAGI